MTSTIGSTTDRNRNTATQTQTTQNTQNTKPATSQVQTGDTNVRGQDGQQGRGYGVDLNNDSRYDGSEGVLAFDFNKDGKYSGQEISDSRDGLKAFGGNKDLNGDGGSDAAEAQTADRLASLVSRFDANGNGRLESNELKAAGGAIVSDNGVKGLDDLSAGDRKAALQSLDPQSGSALLNLLDGQAPADEAGDKPAEEAAGDAPAGGSAPAGGPASPKGPTESVDAPAGFLWKPESDSNGNLVVLLPKQWAGKVKGVKVTSPDGATLGEGSSKGTFGDGRPIFRFDKPGAGFPNGSVCVITMNDGSTQSVVIPNTSIRNEGNGGGGGDKGQGGQEAGDKK